MSLPPFLSSIIDWLRAGYPNGVPEQDYVPLFALLTRRLSEDEVDIVTAALVDDGDLPISKTDIQVLITKITNEMPLESDVDRVRSHLSSGDGRSPVHRRPDPCPTGTLPVKPSRSEPGPAHPSDSRRYRGDEPSCPGSSDSSTATAHPSYRYRSRTSRRRDACATPCVRVRRSTMCPAPTTSRWSWRPREPPASPRAPC